MALDNLNRRSGDSNDQDEIERLIELEDDAKVRLQLIIMNRINLSMIANTSTINAVATKLDTHLTHFEERTKKEDELLNKGRGAWKVIGWIIGIVQVIGLGIWVKANDEIMSIHSQLQVSAQYHRDFDNRLKHLEERE